jgi:hypothetical protein
LDIAEMDRDLIVGPYQINLCEEATTRDLMCIIVDMSDRIAVRYGTGVESSLIAAGSPTVIFLGD